MIKEMKLLTKLELYNLYGWNVFFHTKDTKAKRRYLLLMAVWLLVIAMVVFYAGGLSYGLVWLGMTEIVPSYFIMLVSLLVFVFGIFKAGNMIFVKKGYDMICSLPVRTSSIVMSRFLAMYVEDLLLTFLVIVPGVGVYGYLVRPGIWFYIVMLLGSLLVPVFPLVISVLLGTLVLAIASRAKYKSLVQTILMVVFVVGALLGSINIGQFAEEATTDVLAYLATSIHGMIIKLYPPAMWIGEAVIKGKSSGLLIFLFISVASGSIMVTLVTRNFHGISRRLATTSATHNYKIGELKTNGVRTSLFKREMKRYFASSIYVINTIIGAIMGLIISIAICVVGIDEVQTMLELPMDVGGMIPYVVAGVFSMMTTTSVSISMEGKQVWIVKTLPIATKAVLDSKILLNLSLLAPFYLISEILLMIAMKPKGLDVLWLLCVPTMLILFAVVLGITVNLHLYSFDWAKEGYVVKQSASAMFGGFAGMILALIMGGVMLVVPKAFKDIVQGVFFIVLLSATILLYRKNNETELQKL